MRGGLPTGKLAAHDRWVCVRCRWTASFPLIDVRATSRPSYVCPTCRVKMRCAGAAFRPPPRADDDAWQAVEKLLAAGITFRSSQQRRRIPRTPGEVDRWLALEMQDDAWLAEGKVSVATRADGTLTVRCGRRTLVDRERVLVWIDGWREGVMRLRGDGGRQLVNPVVVVAAPPRTVSLVASIRLRVLRRAS